MEYNDVYGTEDDCMFGGCYLRPFSRVGHFVTFLNCQVGKGQTAVFKMMISKLLSLDTG